MIGTKLAHYEITSHLGSGGMGEVYQATDSKLGRSVAIKLLPDAFIHDTERAARFEREARVLASLNHPNIAAIHGIEESGGRKFLVMELVPGETLAERIKRGPIPVDESLEIARQICEALEAAHEKGIIHRDLKPANVKITPEGKVKVLDFGLAKAMEQAPTATFSNSPTLLSMAATNAGLILGTAAYMSPEQAKGKTVDKRADIWAFGVVLYEMLAGKVAFSGETVSETMAFVMTKEPDWNALPANTPSRIHQLLRRCLMKDPRLRLRDIGDARIAVDEMITNPHVEGAAIVPDSPLAPQPRRHERLVWISAVAILVLIVVVLAAFLLRPAPPVALLRLSAELGADVALADEIPGNVTVAVSPDGNILAFVAVKSGMNQIYIRRFGQLQAEPLAGTAGATSPFFSPDGQWVAFFADGKLKKISVTGGGAVSLCDVPAARGGAWGEDGNIVFSPDAASTANVLQRVSSAGGKSEPVTKLGPGEVTHRWPNVLPGARAVLYTALGALNGFDAANIVVQPLPTGTPKVVVRGGYHAQYLLSGHLVYIHEGTLFAAPFDLDRLEVTGQPVPAVDGVTSSAATGSAHFAVSKGGTLAYLQGQSSGPNASILWMSSDGKTTPLRPMPSDWSNPHFAPDGRRLAVDILDKRAAVYIYEWTRDTLTRLTFGPLNDWTPVWTPDGRRIVFTSDRDQGIRNLYWERADGTGEVQRLTESKNPQVPSSWHPSGKYLAYYENDPKTGNNDVMILPLEGDEISGWKPGKPTVFLNSPASEQDAMFSPDGRWIAYASNESGRNEIFVRPFPGPGGKWQISTAGGTEPRWSRTRRELFYRTQAVSQIMVATYTPEGDSFKVDKPRLWSEQSILSRPRQRSFDLHPDGNRLVVAAPRPSEEKHDKVTLIFNFFDELRHIAPQKK